MCTVFFTRVPIGSFIRSEQKLFSGRMRSFPHNFQANDDKQFSSGGSGLWALIYLQWINADRGSFSIRMQEREREKKNTFECLTPFWSGLTFPISRGFPREGCGVLFFAHVNFSLTVACMGGRSGRHRGATGPVE